MPTYKVQRPGPGAHSFNHHTRRALDAFDGLGLVDALPDVRTALARAEHLADAERAAPASYDALRASLADELATGAVTLDAAIDKVVAAQRAADRHGAGVELIRRAGDAAARVAWKTLCAYGDRLITDLLRPEAEAAVDVIAELGPTFPPDVTDDSSAMAATPKVLESWVRLGEAYDRWATIHKLADELRRAGALPLPATVKVTGAPAPILDSGVDPNEFRFGRPDRLVQYTTGQLPHPALLLVKDIEAGAEPGLLTGDDVMARQQTIRAEQAGDEGRRKMVSL